MTQRVTTIQINNLLEQLNQLAEIARAVLRVGNDELAEFRAAGYFSGKLEGSGGTTTLDEAVKAWLRQKAVELEESACNALSDMYLDTLDVVAVTGTPPVALTALQLTVDSERNIMTARLVQLRDALERLSPLHAVLTALGQPA